MDNLPYFDQFHTNAAACTMACKAAVDGDFHKALRWLNDATTALEYIENADDHDAAEMFVRELADRAGVDIDNLGPEPPKQEPPKTTFNPKRDKLSCGDALRAVDNPSGWLLNLPEFSAYDMCSVSAYRSELIVRRESWPAGERVVSDRTSYGYAEHSDFFVVLRHAPGTHYGIIGRVYQPSYDDLIADDWVVKAKHEFAIPDSQIERKR